MQHAPWFDFAEARTIRKPAETTTPHFPILYTVWRQRFIVFGDVCQSIFLSNSEQAPSALFLNLTPGMPRRALLLL